MAFYILLNKSSETDDYVDYEFGEKEENVGCLRLDKKTGEVTELRELELDESGAVFIRARWKVLQHFRAGEFPDRSCWAS